MENIIVALASEKGIVVIDDTGSLYTAGLLRDLIRTEFGRDDFAYVINTHHHWDHAWGNQVFSDVCLVGHELCVAEMKRDKARLPEITQNFRSSLNSARERLRTLTAGTPEFKDMQVRVAFMERNYKGLQSGFEPTPPAVTFRDRMSLNLGDLTIKLFYFGRAHSGCDILIQVPEEGLLLTGDLFLERGWLPLFAGRPVLDIPRWIEVLQAALDGEDEVKYVIPGHRDIWKKEKLILWRDYIVELWAGVKNAKNEGLSIEEAFLRFPLDKKFNYLQELGHDQEELDRFQKKNIGAFWNQVIE